MPALVNRRVGSFAGTSEEERTMRCPRVAKKSRKRCLVSWPVTGWSLSGGLNSMIAERVRRRLGRHSPAETQRRRGRRRGRREGQDQHGRTQRKQRHGCAVAEGAG